MQHSRRAGFTLVELVTSMTVMGILIILIGAIITTSYGASYSARELAVIDRNMQNAMDAIENDLRAGIKVKSMSIDGSAMFYDQYGYGSDVQPTRYTWTYFGSSTGSSSPYRALLIMQYVLSKRDSSTLREPVYVATPYYNCTTQKKLQPKLRRLVVYFVRNSTLYRRILVEHVGGLGYCDAGIDLFYANGMSAPAEAAANDPRIARAGFTVYEDEPIARNVTSFKPEYFVGDDAVANQYDPTQLTTSLLDDVDAVKVNLSIASPNRSVSSSQSVIMRRVNAP